MCNHNTLQFIHNTSRKHKIKVELPLLKSMVDSTVLRLYKMPSYLILLLEVKLIKLPTYESSAELDLEVSVDMFNCHSSTTRQF